MTFRQRPKGWKWSFCSLAAIFKSLEDCRTDRTSWKGTRWAIFHLQVWSPKTGDVCRIPHSARFPKSSPQDACWEAQQLFNINWFTPKILSLSSWFGTATWRIHGGSSPCQKHCHGCHGTMQHEFRGECQTMSNAALTLFMMNYRTWALSPIRGGFFFSRNHSETLIDPLNILSLA